MKIRFALLVISLLLLSSTPASAEQMHCLMLKGFGFPLDTSVLFVSSLGLKSGGRNGWALWTDKNVEEIVVLNPENKTYMVVPLGETFTDGASRRHGQRNVEPVKKLGTATLCGLKCSGYATSRLEWWSCTETPCDKKASDAWSKHLGLPVGYGLPVRIRRMMDGAFKTTMCITSAAPATKPADFFALNPDFHRVTDQTSLMFSKGGGKLKAADIDDLFIMPTK
jgi:hypothetical protein